MPPPREVGGRELSEERFDFGSARAVRREQGMDLTLIQGGLGLSMRRTVAVWAPSALAASPRDIPAASRNVLSRVARTRCATVLPDLSRATEPPSGTFCNLL